MPVINPRVPDYVTSETNIRTTSGQNTVNAATGLTVQGTQTRITQSGDLRVTQQTGEPPNGLNTTPGTDPNAPNPTEIGLPYNNTSVPKTGTLT